MIMKKYKVVKDFDILTKGDVFTLNDDRSYTCTVKESANSFTYSSTITVSPLYMAKAIHEGNVIELNPEDTTNYKKLYTTYKASWDNTMLMLNKLLVGYNQDLNEVIAEFNAGKLAECLKLEKTTVLANLIRQVEDIKSKMKL